MKKQVLFLSFLGSVSILGQTNQELKIEIENIKKGLNNLQTSIEEVKTQNLYLKKVLDIRKSIIEVEKDKTIFTLIQAEGNKVNKTITLTLLLNAKEKKKEGSMDNISVIDIEGNEIEIDYLKSDEVYFVLSSDVPRKLKLTFVYENLPIDLPPIIKILRFRFNYKYTDMVDIYDNRENIELRDFPIKWN